MQETKQVTSELQNLWQKAKEASAFSYSPYSLFPVGAALLTKQGEIITGCNIENRSYSLCICAERVAFFKAISQGKKDFLSLAVATPKANYPVSPCGACRQVATEFMKEDATVVFGSSPSDLVVLQMKDLFSYDCLHELKKDKD